MITFNVLCLNIQKGKLIVFHIFVNRFIYIYKSQEAKNQVALTKSKDGFYTKMNYTFLEHDVCVYTK